LGSGKVADPEAHGLIYKWLCYDKREGIYPNAFSGRLFEEGGV
jgi:hypothetical protein